MSKLLLLLSCWLIASGSICQSPPAGFPDTPTITENSVGKARIGMPVAELRKLYKGYSFEPRSMVVYGYDNRTKDGTASGLCIKFRGQELFVADILDSKVWGLYVLDSHYKTAKGMYVGATAYMLKKALPSLKVAHVKWNYSLQRVENDKEETVNYWFKNVEGLGNYKEANKLNKGGSELVPLIGSTPVVSWIEVTDVLL